VIVLKLKHFGYLGFLIIISCISLIPLKLANSNNISEYKPRVLIKSTEKHYIPKGTEDALLEGVRVPMTTGTSGVQILPIPSSNSPIIITPL
jgi:hypothetical protein